MAMRWIQIIAFILKLTGAVPEPTSAAMLQPRAQSPVGWYAAVDTAGSTHWNLQTVPATLTLTTTGTVFEYCKSLATSTCWLAYGCAGSSIKMVGSVDSTSYCGSYSTCLYDFLYSSYGASERLTNYYCAPTGVSPTAFYAVSPAISVPTPSVTAAKSKSSTGPIVGGVIGGLALLGLLTGITLFMCLKHKRAKRETDPYDLPAVVRAPGYNNPPGCYGPDKGAISPSANSYPVSPSNASTAWSPQPNSGTFAPPPTAPSGTPLSNYQQQPNPNNSTPVNYQQPPLQSGSPASYQQPAARLTSPYPTTYQPSNTVQVGMPTSNHELYAGPGTQRMPSLPQYGGPP